MRESSAVGADAKLALTEALLRSSEATSCAQRCLDWLARYAGIEHALVAGVDVDTKRLVGIAGFGIPGSPDELVLDLEDRSNPLVRVLEKKAPAFFSARQGQTTNPFGEGVSLHAIPLMSLDSASDGNPTGILLASAREPVLDAVIHWAASALGSKLGRMRASDAAAEARFSRERTLLYTILNAVTDPILLTDTEGRLIVANSRAERLFTARDDDSEGRRRAVALNNMLLSAALSGSAMDRSGTQRYELPLVDPTEGSDLLFELLTSPFIDRKDGPCIVSILRNVTDLGRATEEIRESYGRLKVAEADVRAERHRLELIIDNVADPILVTDPSGDIALTNAPAEKLFVASKDVGPEAQLRVRANDAHFYSFVSNLLFSGDEIRWRGEIGLVDPASGVAIPVEAIAGKVLSERGELTAVVTILHDRTEALQKAQLYEQLRALTEQLEVKVQSATAELAQQNEVLRRQHIELEQASALKSRFLANMSHEFRTPLNAVLGYTSMLLQGVSGELSPAQKKSLTRVDSNSRHLLTLINEILDITRIEAGRMPLNLSKFALPDLTAEVLAELDPIVSRSKLEVTTDLAPGLPKLRSDRAKVKQIVLNLLTNALKFTPRGSVTIRGRHDMKAEVVKIAVEDTGIGISGADQAKLFEDFHQVDNSPTRPYGGTGLGLSICRRLAVMLGGRISVVSVLGQGSTFTVELPATVRRSK
ncbi:PAS domain-containing protein [bacterium]|nr:PAS domain-containing protein [bacterium]